MSYPDNKTFTITCTMRERWVPHFLAMIKYMQKLGSWGSSRDVTIFADGDGDFRPRFEWDESLPSDAEPVAEYDGNRRYDAG